MATTVQLSFKIGL